MSITQKKSEVKSLADRLTAIERIHEQLQALESSGKLSRKVRDYYFERIITLDLQLFAVKIGHASEEFFNVFAERAGLLLADVSEEIWKRAGGAHKELVRLAITGDRAKTLERLAAEGL